MQYDFRLSGHGGAALMLRYNAATARLAEAESPRVGFDVGFLDPTRFIYYLNRRAEDGFLGKLGQYLFDAAAELHPEQSVPDFIDSKMRLVVSVRSSTDLSVELEMRLFPGPDDPDADGLNFETSRAVLTAVAAQLAATIPGRGLDIGLET